MTSPTSEPIAERATDALGGVTIERSGPVLLIGLDRPAKRNALSPKILADLAAAYALYEADDELRCAVVFGHGQMFCGGADLILLHEALASGELDMSDRYDPFQMMGKKLTKPVVAAIHGACVAGGMEIALAADVIFAAEGTVMGQPETARGLFAFGGGSVRLVQRVGWGNAQRYLLTGEMLDAAEAYRIGLVQEVVAPESLGQRALEYALSVAKAAPLGVRDNLVVGHLALTEGEDRAFEETARRRAAIIQTADAKEGVVSFLERREGNYVGA
jgi:enoyl-CoA hydratase/carnithine racemase